MLRYWNIVRNFAYYGWIKYRTFLCTYFYILSMFLTKINLIKYCSKNIIYIATICVVFILVLCNKVRAEVFEGWRYYSDAEVSIVDNVYNNQSTLYGNGNNLFIISDDAIDNNNFYNAMVLNSINNTTNNTNDTNSNNDYDIKFDGVVPKSVNYIYGRKSFDKPIDNTLMMVDVDNTTNDDYDTGNKTIYAVYSDMAEVANNKLYLNNGNFYIVNAMTSEKGTVKNNTTVINNGSFQNLTNALTYTGSVENNSVYINNGVFDYIYGAMASNGGNVIGNKVYITGGKFSNNIIAGYASSPYSIIDNNILVMDGNINIDNSFSIFGAKANKGKATNNKVVLGRNLKLEYLDPNYKLKIYGQYGAGNTNTATTNTNNTYKADNNSNNNTLEIYTKDINLYNIANFDNYYFILPENITNGDVIIKTNRTIKLDNANIGLALHKNLDLNKGDKITLFSNARGNFNLVDLDTSLLEFPEDIYVIKSNETTLTRSEWAIKYGVDIVYNDNNALELVVNDVEKLPVNNHNNTNTSNTNNNDINNTNNTNIENNNNTLDNNIIIPELKPEALAMFSSREAILSVLDNDNIADIDGDFDFDNNNTNNSNNTDTFYYDYNNTNNNDNAYKNNRIDNITFFKAGNINSVTSNGEKIEGYSMAMGMLFNTYRQNYFGIFMNVGNAEYKNKDFIYSSDVSENGSVEFVGIGGMAKYKLISTFNTFTYFDTNISGGTLRNKWNHLFVQNVGYDLSSIYFTGNLGVGIKFAINKWCESELYSKYFYTFVEGDNSNIGNDFVQFYDLKQQKIRIGNKWNVKISNNINNFLGFGVDIKKSLDYNDFGAVNYIPVNKYNNYRNFYTENQQIVYNQSYDKHNEYDKVFYFEYGINFRLFRKKLNNILKFRVDRYKFGNNKNKNLNYGTNNSRNYMADYANDNGNYNAVSGYANYAEKNNNRNTLLNISFSATYPF